MFGVMNTNAAQINLPAALIANGIGIYLMLAILFGKHTRIRIFSREESLYRGMCYICVVLSILEMAGFLLENRVFLGARQLAIVSNTLTLLFAIVLALFWVFYINSKLRIGYRQARRNAAVAIAFATPIALLVLANLFHPVFFGMDENNNYYRTNLFILPWIAMFGYMAWGAWQSYRYQRKADKRLFTPVLMFLIPVYLGGLLQLLFYGISLIWVSVALGLTCIHIRLQSEQAYLDPLTKLYNRNYLIQYMDLIEKEAQRGLQVTGIMLDINDFKTINDTMGHAAGDEVLRAVGGMLLRATENNSVIRYGGDEFVVLLENASPEWTKRTIDRINQEVAKYNESGNAALEISLSIGASVFSHTDMFEFFQDLDRRMYASKREFYISRERNQELSEEA